MYRRISERRGPRPGRRTAPNRSRQADPPGISRDSAPGQKADPPHAILVGRPSFLFGRPSWAAQIRSAPKPFRTSRYRRLARRRKTTPRPRTRANLTVMVDVLSRTEKSRPQLLADREERVRAILGLSAASTHTQSARRPGYRATSTSCEQGTYTASLVTRTSARSPQLAITIRTIAP